MPFNYDRPSRPCFYNERWFDSELEAAWAAFFDQRSIIHEYHPSMGYYEWNPDFLVNLGQGNMLAEVKPISKITEWKNYTELQAKIQKTQDPECFMVAFLGLSPATETSFYYSLQPPDPEFDPPNAEPRISLERIDFGDPEETLVSWSRARNKTKFIWGKK